MVPPNGTFGTMAHLLLIHIEPKYVPTRVTHYSNGAAVTCHLCGIEKFALELNDSLPELPVAHGREDLDMPTAIHGRSHLHVRLVVDESTSCGHNALAPKSNRTKLTLEDVAKRASLRKKAPPPEEGTKVGGTGLAPLETTMEKGPKGNPNPMVADNEPAKYVVALVSPSEHLSDENGTTKITPEHDDGGKKDEVRCSCPRMWIHG